MNLESTIPKEKYDVKHGQFFDDNRRWCACCQRSIMALEASEADEWQDKICPKCTSLWPEYEEEIKRLIFSHNEEEDLEIT